MVQPEREGGPAGPRVGQPRAELERGRDRRAAVVRRRARLIGQCVRGLLDRRRLPWPDQPAGAGVLAHPEPPLHPCGERVGG
jgi:hypothetical protein